MARNQPIIVKKIKKISGGHHGGAWKVAYADFVTAMMAFFLLMWLINTTTPEQKRGVADFFAPASVSKSQSGSGGILAGTALAEEGVRSSGSADVVERLSPDAPRIDRREAQESTDPTATNPTDSTSDVSEAALNRALSLREQAEFDRAEQSLRQAMQDMPDLAELSKHLLIDQTPEGLRIQIIDQDGRSMFESGSSRPHPRAETLLRAVSRVIERLPNRVAISGHTDDRAGSDPRYTNWELSSDRANTARRLLTASGLSQDRIYNVAGKAGSEPLYPDAPDLPGNRRISIVLLREAPVLPPGHRLGGFGD
jgi:chemotaxis protein MotB